MNEPTPEMTSAPSRPAAPRPYRRSHFGGPRHQSRNRPGLAPALDASGFRISGGQEPVGRVSFFFYSRALRRG